MLSSGQRCFILIVILLVINVAALARAEAAQVPVSYDLKVTIEPAAGTIAVQGKIDVPRSDSTSKTIQFGLHETFATRELSVNGHTARFSFQAAQPSPIFPATRNVVVELPPSLPPDKIHLELEYGGRLKEIPEFGTFPDQKLALDDQINSRLVELASYSSWYPQFFTFGRPIQISLEVSLPQGWIAICSGKKIGDRVQAGRAITQWSSPKDNDVLITASPNYKEKSIPLPNGEIQIYYTQLPEEFIEKEGRQIAQVMALFTERFGETTIPSGTVKHVFSPKRKGQGRAGIARTGMIVTSEGRVLEELTSDPKYSLLQDVAHEIGHFWWDFGAGQGDWINEAFAEYSSAIAVEKILSEEQFHAVLENYRNEVHDLPADSPSLANVPFDGSGFVIRYYKGSLMLDDLRRSMGDDRFFSATRDFFQKYKGGSIGTAEFRSFWKDKLGEKKQLVDPWLDSTGGMPQAEERAATTK